ncbi:MAG: recombinase family protein [Myxococcales bacterium]|nr:recombinase family protein [Myxococcales bacterium]
MQAQEGVSLDAQRERIRCYCKASGFNLVHLAQDETSAKSLDRPGLTAALKLLETGKADALLVVKLDRLTRSVIDLGTLLNGYFLNEQHYLLSVTESLDTRNAMGRFVLYILALIAQWEREAIGERTREAMRHLKAQGVFLGRAPYGHRFGTTRDASGRARLEPHADEQIIIARIVDLHKKGVPQKDIVSALRADETPGPRGTGWNRTMILRILKRAGAMPERIREYRKRERRKVQRDKKAAETRAKELRAEGLSLRAIGERLLKEGLYPPRGEQWYAATVAELLSVKGADEAAVRARELRAEGHSLREIARLLLYEGYQPAPGRLWDGYAVSQMLRATSSLVHT